MKIKFVSALRASSLLLGAVVLFAGCEQKGPAEQAGENLDQAGQNVRDAVDPPSGPVEGAGRAVERTVNP